MKKRILFFLLVLCIGFGFGQTVIVTIDRDNVAGPTATGTDTGISATGLTRGSGIIQATNNQNFTSSQWNATSQIDTEANNEYIEWSVTAGASNTIEVTELDIRARRNNNGPVDWQIFYSLDNFSTAGIALTATQTATSSASDFNFSGLSVESGVDGNITFRLYAWNSSTNGGWFRIQGRNAWSDFGIASPGIRIWGNITEASNDSESNVISTAFDSPDNIDYTLFSATSGLTTSNSIKIGEFAIQDGGDDLTDADLVSTFLTDITFNVSGSNNIAALAIFDGTTNVAEGSVNNGSISFNNLNGGLGIEASDNSSKAFDVYATFNTVVTDNEQIQLTVASALADIVNGSSFSSADAGSAQTSISGDDNRMMVTATRIIFDQQPTDTAQFVIMTPSPTVIAVDANGSQDLDANGTITVLSGGSLQNAPIIYSLSNGVSVFDTIQFNSTETDITLFALASGVLGFTESDIFSIGGPTVCLVAQDFDGTTPEWGYTSDVAFFDNGWGTDGYFGLIDISSASPLNLATFSGNILGENDLNDEGNGTTGFANITFDTIDISNYNNVTLSFDWQVIGYSSNNDDLQYELIYDGVGQGIVSLFDGSNATSDGSGSENLAIPNSVSTIGLIVSIRNNSDQGFSGFDNFKLSSIFDGLIYSNNAWSPNPPSDTTGSENALIVDGTYVVGSNVVLNDLIISEGATTSISLGQSITTNGGVINNGTLELNSASSSYSSLISTDEVIGEVIYNRHVNQFADTGTITGNNDLISAPVTSPNQDFLALRTANPNLPSGDIGGTLSYLFGPFDNNANEYVIWNGTNDSEPIESGIGYRTASTDVGGSTFTFTGNVAITQAPIPISVGTGSIYNLVGNPYPSYITLDGFLSVNNSEFDPMFSGVYGYDGDATDGFQIWNQAYSDANPNAVIAPGQGFLVTSNVGGGSISFPSSIRSIGTADDFIAGRIANPNIGHVKLKLRSASNKQYFTDIYFNDNASLGLDYGYDSAVFESTPNFAIYSQLVEENQGIDLGVQSVDYSSLNNVVIPIGINASAGEQFTISTEQLNIPDGVEVYLEDTQQNVFVSLRDSDYTLTPNTELRNTGRFFLRFGQDALSTGENTLADLVIYNTNAPKELVIKGQLSSASSLELYDIQGRGVLSKELDAQLNTQTIDISNINSGIYLVNIKSEKEKRTIKIIIK